LLLHPNRPYFFAPTGARCGSPTWRAASSATIQIVRTHTALRRACTAIRPVRVRIAASPNGPMRSAFSALLGCTPGRSGTQCPWFNPDEISLSRTVFGCLDSSAATTPRHQTHRVGHDCVRSPSSCGTSVPMEGFAHDAPAAASHLRRGPEHTGRCVNRSVDGGGVSSMRNGRCRATLPVVMLAGSMVVR
jgi:hypothetical protein